MLFTALLKKSVPPSRIKIRLGYFQHGGLSTDLYGINFPLKNLFPLQVDKYLNMRVKCNFVIQVKIGMTLFFDSYDLMQSFWTFACCEPEIVLKIKQNNFKFATRTIQGIQETVLCHILGYITKLHFTLICRYQPLLNMNIY